MASAGRSARIRLERRFAGELEEKTHVRLPEPRLGSYIAPIEHVGSVGCVLSVQEVRRFWVSGLRLVLERIAGPKPRDGDLFGGSRLVSRDGYVAGFELERGGGAIDVRIEDDLRPGASG